MDVDFKTAVFLFKAANTHYQIQRGRLIVHLHDLRGSLAAFIERNGPDKEQGFSASIEIAEAELRELQEAYHATNKALRERFGDVFG